MTLYVGARSPTVLEYDTNETDNGPKSINLTRRALFRFGTDLEQIIQNEKLIIQIMC